MKISHTIIFISTIIIFYTTCFYTEFYIQHIYFLYHVYIFVLRTILFWESNLWSYWNHYHLLIYMFRDLLKTLFWHFVNIIYNIIIDMFYGIWIVVHVMWSRDGCWQLSSHLLQLAGSAKCALMDKPVFCVYTVIIISILSSALRHSCTHNKTYIELCVSTSISRSELKLGLDKTSAHQQIDIML